MGFKKSLKTARELAQEEIKNSKELTQEVQNSLSRLTEPPMPVPELYRKLQSQLGSIQSSLSYVEKDWPIDAIFVQIHKAFSASTEIHNVFSQPGQKNLNDISHLTLSLNDSLNKALSHLRDEQSNSKLQEEITANIKELEEKELRLVELQNNIERQYSHLTDYKKELDDAFKVSKKKISDYPNQHLEYIKDEVESLKVELSTIIERTQLECTSISNDSIEEIKSNLVSFEHESIKKINNISSKQLEALNKEHLAAETRLNETLSNALENGEKKNLSYLKQVGNMITKQQSELQDEITSQTMGLKDLINEEVRTYQDLKDNLQNEFNEKVAKLEKQLSIVTSGVMADQHIKQANTERYVYWILQIAGFAFMLAAIYAGAIFFSEITNVRLPFFQKPDLVIHVDGSLAANQNPMTLMFMRLSMIILLTAPAIYLLKEASVHRHKENIYRQRGIQLATISPYLEELEKDERAAIKKDLVASFFQFHDGKVDTQNVPDFLKDMKEAVGIAKSLNSQTKTVSQRFGRKPKP
ncbi:hypothetical protein MHO82_01890 [Vibrio sp. Of7-15]|uniref:hypothetical protein n=1 Tax=Vibrio sp. Of7-15 TaxID=2724879 RepID=UPI001EF3B17D|nr:hypothetical protein [Vibrio sp. Of7-15]MCG7495612.1 hypothetical protein [Vibrio sp. Of7-15]